MSRPTARRFSPQHPSPYLPAGRRGATCACACCGFTAEAFSEVSQYPHRWIPAGWTRAGADGWLRCGVCKRAEDPKHALDTPFFVDENGALTPSRLRVEAPLTIADVAGGRDHVADEAAGMRAVITTLTGITTDELDGILASENPTSAARDKLYGKLRARGFSVEDAGATVRFLGGANPTKPGALRVRSVRTPDGVVRYDVRSDEVAQAFEALLEAREEEAPGVVEAAPEIQEEDTPMTTTTALTTTEETKPEEPTKPSRKARVKQQAKEAAGAVGLGLQLAAANEAGEILVDMAKELAKDVPALQLALAHPDGREVAKLLMAFMVQTMAEQTNVVPQADAVATACKLQMTASSFTLVGPRLNKLRKHFTKLGRVGSAAAVTAGVAGAGAVHARVSEGDAEDDLRDELEELKAEIAELRAKGAQAQR